MPIFGIEKSSQLSVGVTGYEAECLSWCLWLLLLPELAYHCCNPNVWQTHWLSYTSWINTCVSNVETHASLSILPDH